MTETQIVTFRSIYLRYQLHLRPERLQPMADGGATTIPAHVVSFENGLYTSYDQAEIELIRKSRPYAVEKIVFEEKEAEIETLKKAEEAKQKDQQTTIRGNLTTEKLHSEAGLSVPQSGMARLAERSTQCDVPGCGKIFEEDPHGKRLRMHQQKHRREEEAKAILREKQETEEE